MEINRRFAQGAAVLGLAAMLAVPVFAETDANANGNAPTNTNAATNVNAPTNTNGSTNVNAPTNTNGPRKGKPALDIACVKAAVTARETAIGAAWDTSAAAVKAALSARKTSLEAAWNMTDAKARREAIKSAWRTYRESLKNARKTLRDSRRTAWKTFRDAAKKCGPGAGSEDIASGQDQEL